MKKPPINTFREARERRGLTQAEAAALAGVSSKQVYALERGTRKNPTWTVMASLARVYRVRPEVLLPPQKRVRTYRRKAEAAREAA